MKQRRVGPFRVGEVALGGLALSKEGRPPRDVAIDTIHAAVDAGVTLIDTADSYHTPGEPPGHNHWLIAQALTAKAIRRHEVVISTKGGHIRDPEGNWLIDGSPDHLVSEAKQAAQRLGVNAIDIYHLHRPDPPVPYEESVGALKTLLDDGVIRTAGISNADQTQIRIAESTLRGGLVSVQNQFGPNHTPSHTEMGTCAERGLAFLSWQPFGGLQPTDPASPVRRIFSDVAADLGVTRFQVSIAWALAQSPVVIPIAGATAPHMIEEAAAASTLDVPAHHLARLNRAAGV